MVDVTVLPEQPKSDGFNFFQSILFPGLLFLGLFFLARRGRGNGQSCVVIVSTLGISWDGG
jgi:hypothetical protein